MSELFPPPLPTIGELLHLFCLSFSDLGEEGAGRNAAERRRREALGKRLLRVSGGSDMRADECLAILDEQLAPLKRASPEFGARLGEWGGWSIDYYRSLIPDLECGALSRTQVLPVLAAHVFLPMAAHLVRGLEVTETARSWADDDYPATALVLQWWLDRQRWSQVDLAREHAQRRKPAIELRSIQASVSAWIGGRAMDVRSIMHFYDGANDRLADGLLLARAFRRFWEGVAPGHRDRLRRVWRARLVAPADGTDLGEVDRELLGMALADPRGTMVPAFLQANADIEVLTHPRQHKNDGDASCAMEILDRMEATNPIAEMGWRVSALRARHHVLMGRHEDAIAQYELAFDGVRYRSGPMAEAILKELLIVSAFLGRKSEGKPWAAWAAAIGLTPAVRDEIFAYFSFFPLHAHYREADMARIRTRAKAMDGRHAVWDGKWAKERLDHRYKDRLRKGFGRIRKTELMIHAARGDAHKVKSLIEHGADVNVVAEDNSTALIQAVGARAQDCIGLILPRCTPETVNRITAAKRNSAMWMAIEQNDPDLVTRLIAAGADVTLGYGEINVSPLFDAVRRCSDIQTPMGCFLTDAAIKSALNYTPPLPGVHSTPFLEEQIGAMRSQLVRSMTDPRHRAMFLEVLEAFSAGEPERRKRIVEILLDAGADPNQSEQSLPGFTPFLMAAEGGKADVFDLLLGRRGNLLSTTSKQQTALWLSASQCQWEMARHILAVASQEQAAFLVSCPDVVHGTQPIHLVVHGIGDDMTALRFLETLLEHGADPNARTLRGDTPLSLAGRLPRTPCVARAIDKLREAKPN